MKRLLLSLVLFCLFISGVQAQDTVYKWTSSTGQTVDAAFVKLDGETLTIDMNGQSFFFPLATLSPQSQALAKILATPEGDPLPVKDGVYDWTDSSGKTIRAKFVKLVGSRVTIEMNGKPFALPMSRFSPASQELAKVLAERAPETPGDKPKPVSRKGLRKDKPQQWTSSNGQTIEALFVKLSNDVLTIDMKGKVFDLPLSRLSPDSQEVALLLAEMKTPQEKAIEAKMKAAEEAGAPDKAEIAIALENAQKYFVDLAEKDEESWPFAPHRRRKVVGQKEVTVKYRRVTYHEPIYEYKDVEKEVYRMVKEGGSEAIAVRKKVKVKVRVRGEQIGTRPRERLVRDNDGPIERVEKRNVYGPGGADFWNSGKLGHNALAYHAMFEAGLDPSSEIAIETLNKLTDLYKTFGYPDLTWDLAWSICALSYSTSEEHRELAKELAAKLAGAQIRSGVCSGLWGPVALDLELLGILSSANVAESEEFQKWQNKFKESQRVKDEERALIALENVRKMNVLRDEYSMLLKTPAELYYHYHNLADPGQVHPTITVMGFPHYVYNQTSADLGSTMLALYALSVAGRKGVLPEEATILAFPGNVRKFGRKLTIAQVMNNAATALTRHQLDTGAFNQMNLHQPVTNFNNGLVVRGLPPSREKYPDLETPSTLADTATGLVALDLAGVGSAARYTEHRRAAASQIKRKMVDALYAGDKEMDTHSTFGKFDLVFALAVPSVSGDDRKELLSDLARYLIDSQHPNGGWLVRTKPKLPISTSSRVRFHTLTELKGRETFDYSKPHTPHKGYLHGNYFAHSPWLIGTAYSMLALSYAQKLAPEPPPSAVTAVTETPAEPAAPSDDATAPATTPAPEKPETPATDTPETTPTPTPAVETAPPTPPAAAP